MMSLMIVNHHDADPDTQLLPPDTGLAGPVFLSYLFQLNYQCTIRLAMQLIAANQKVQGLNQRTLN
jgi:hypothetical protein